MTVLSSRTLDDGNRKMGLSSRDKIKSIDWIKQKTMSLFVEFIDIPN